MEKWGGMRKKVGKEVKGGVKEGRKGNQWKMKVRKMGEKGKHEMKKPSRCAQRGVLGK